MCLRKSVPVRKISLLSHRSYLEWLFTHWPSATPYRWVKWRVPDPSLVPFPFSCTGWQLVNKKVRRLHFVLEEITSPFQWCKAFRANSILPAYNGSTPNEGQSVLGIICFTKYLFKLLSDASRYIFPFPHTVSSAASVHRVLQGQCQLL